ncbi:ABC transporter substrate-binding protein [Haloprofundus halobius]|uniref:ABC transporter substrate-binding protein n=1 Tax=Haloprofundus halobius TaxID=2876194 RepID=UPI001CCE3DB2|nr:ABC transporter substrate-binding protein [Haloprofundus halobius]
MTNEGMTGSLFPDDPRPKPKVVSTSPSGTEICYALGVEPVAVSHACDFPAAVDDRPVIDRSRVTGESSADRHRSVGEARREGGAYEVDRDLLLELQPDLVLSQSVCGVCAVDETLVRETLGDAEIEVLGLSASTLGDVFDCVAEVGDATGRVERAEAVVERCRRRIDAVWRERPVDAPRVAVVEWMDPLRVAGNWVPEVVAAAGGEYGLAEPGQSSVAVEWADLVDDAPEVLVVAPCSYDPEQTRARLDELASRPGWESLPAVERGNVHVLDGTVLNRWTPRLVESVEELGQVCRSVATD